MPRLSFLLGVALLAGLATPSGQLATATSVQQPPPAQAPAAGRGRGGVPVQGAEPDIPLVDRFDKDGNKRLDYVERTASVPLYDAATVRTVFKTPPARSGSRPTIPSAEAFRIWATT